MADHPSCQHQWVKHYKRCGDVYPEVTSSPPVAESPCTRNVVTTPGNVVINEVMNLVSRLRAATFPQCVCDLCVERREAASALERLAALRSLNRENFHATYNGGWHGNADGMRAFHHGMDTVFNALERALAAEGP